MWQRLKSIFWRRLSNVSTAVTAVKRQSCHGDRAESKSSSNPFFDQTPPLPILPLIRFLWVPVILFDPIIRPWSWFYRASQKKLSFSVSRLRYVLLVQCNINSYVLETKYQAWAVWTKEQLLDYVFDPLLWHSGIYKGSKLACIDHKTAQ